MIDLRKALTPEVSPEVTPDVNAINISQERVDETAKREHEPVAYVTIESVIPSDWRKCPSIKWFNKPTEGPLYTAPPKREWVGLTEEEMEDLLGTIPWPQVCRAIEARLKEKNT